jgi:rod shape-determining protein MreD
MNTPKNNYRLIIFNVLAALILVFIQVGFLTGLPFGLASLNLVLVALVFILVFTGLETAFYWAIGLGFLLDLFTFYPFGSHLISFSLTLLAVFLLLEKFFTNRSLYSFLALVTAASVFYQLFLLAASGLIDVFSGTPGIASEMNFWLAAGRELALNLAVAIAIYYFQNFLSNRLKPVFLQKV